MSESEKLREALFELDQLRARTQDDLSLSEAVLDGLESVALAETPQEALEALLRSVQNSTGCDAAALFDVTDNACQRLATTSQKIGYGDHIDCDYVTSRPLHVARLALVAEKVPDLYCDGAYTEMISAPSVDGHVLVCLSSQAGTLTRLHRKIAERLIPLAVQTVANKRLTDENALLATVIHKSSASFSIARADDPDRKLVYVNKAFEALSGYTAKEVIGQNCRFLTAEEPKAPVRSALREAVARNEQGTFELLNRRKSGEMFWNHLNLYPVQTESGDYIVASQWDLTDRITAEQDRDAAHEQLVSSLSSAREAILLLDGKDQFVFANEQYMALHQLQGHTLARNHPFAEVWMQALIDSGKSPEQARADTADKLMRLKTEMLQHERQLPSGVHVLETVSRTSIGGTVCVLTDVTALKVAQQQLAERAAAIEAVQDGIAILDNDGRFIYLNPSQAHMFGHAAPSDLIGRKWSRLFNTNAWTFIEDHVIPYTRRKGQWRGDIEGLGKDNTPLKLEITLALFKDVGLICVSRDISERLKGEAERAQLQGQLNDAQRQEAIGQMAAGLAHDFNNSLSVISGNATLLLEDETTPETAKHANRILEASARATDLTRRLLDFGMRKTERQLSDIRADIASAVDLVQSSLRGDVQLEFETSQDPLFCASDKTELHQIVTNLIINAQDALEDQPGSIAVSLLPSADDLSGLTPLRGHLNPGQRYAVLTVADTGTGIEQDDMARIFAPYVTTKVDRGGTGLGLAVILSIVMSNGGAIDVTSVKGTGTRFQIYWPLAPDDALNNTPEDTQLTDRDLTGFKALVLDDDVPVAETMAGLLETRGCEVVVCADPREALDVLAADPDYWDVVLTDFDMPEMNGAEFAKRLQKFTAKMPVILCTALPEFKGAKRGAGVFAASLSKPVEVEHLIATVDQVTRRHGDENSVG